MADIVDPKKRSEMMAGIGAKNTKPEIIVRKLLHLSGFRFRLHRNDLPGKPDIVLPKWNTIIFVHGCFWHGHENCPIFRLPKSRTEFWSEKIGANRQRDNRNLVAYDKLDWKVMEVWECALKGKQRLRAERIETQLRTFLMNSTVKKGTIRGQLE